MEIENEITKDDVIWVMTWGERYPDKPPKEEIFETKLAISHLLLNEVINIGTNWWRKSWDDEAKKSLRLSVNCSDIFAWGCSDAEDIYYEEIEELYRMWIEDPQKGPIIWCLKKRRELPQKPVQAWFSEEEIKELTEKYDLRQNFYDGYNLVTAKMKYNAYCAWEEENGKTPRAFDKGWWAGWYEYEKAFPDWYSEEWKKDQELEIDEWKRENGWG